MVSNRAFFALIVLIARPLGIYMANVFERRKTFLDPVLVPIERILYRLTGVESDKEMRWTEYAFRCCCSASSPCCCCTPLSACSDFCLEPATPGALAPVLALNTAASFTTNTNWESLWARPTMSYLTQMAGLAYHNFASAAVGIALRSLLFVVLAVAKKNTIGNFWVECHPSILWVLVPMSSSRPGLVSQGVVQNLHPYSTAHLVGTAEGADAR